ncbi:MAG: phosphoribosylanthranilate isomerase [Bacillota bacterium]
MWIKICGLTNLEDAKLAVSLGADALGFIFAPSKRQISPERVCEIITNLPPGGEKIGVFVDEEKEKVQQIAEFCGLTGLQFHGSESPEYCREFKENIQVIKAFRVDEKRGWDEVIPYIKQKSVNKILLDTFVLGLHGGTGKAFPWHLVPEARKNWGEIPVIIAGGLKLDNVHQAIRDGNPFGIDVSSGVEKELRVKDREKMRMFMAKAKQSSR